MAPDLVKGTELFIVPSSFLVAALGAADTDLHKASVSVLGLIVSVMWQICKEEAWREQLPDPPEPQTKSRIKMLRWLPKVFVYGWAYSVIAHVVLSTGWIVLVKR